jgi:hypothetical protein
MREDIASVALETIAVLDGGFGDSLFSCALRSVNGKRR